MISSRFLIAIATAAASLTQVSANVGSAVFDSQATTPCPVVCQPTDFRVALPVGLFPTGQNCCQRVRATFQGESVEVTFTDLFLAAGTSSNISLSDQAFAVLAPLETGIISPVEWDFISIPTV